MSKELDKLIEQTLKEEMNIKLPTYTKDAEAGKTAAVANYVDSLNTTFKIDNSAYSASGAKNPGDSKKYIELIRKQAAEGVFDFKDLQSITTISGSPEIGSRAVNLNSTWIKPVVVATSANNRLLMQIFLTSGWDGMTKEEKERFELLFFHFDNFGFLMNVPAFIPIHKTVYQNLKQQYDVGSGQIYKTPINVGTQEDPSITSPDLQTGLADKAKMKPKEKVVFDTFFELVGSGKGLSDRLKALNDFTALLVEGGENISTLLFPANMPLADKSRKFIVFTTVMDIFNNFSRNIDHGAGAYYFESFLAYLAGGQAGGKELGAGRGMGEADFLKADGSKGSAKFFQGGSEMSQSWKNFVPGYPVEYVVGWKYDQDDKPTSDIEKLYKIKLISFTIGAAVVNDQRVLQINGESLSLPQMKDSIVDGNVVLTSTAIKNGWKQLGDFIMPQTNSQSLTKLVRTTADKIDKDVGLAYRRFEEVLKGLRTMKSEIQQYSADRDINKAEKAVATADNFRGTVGKLAASYGQQLPTSTIPEGSLHDDPSISSLTGGPSRWQESKSPLDQLIETIAKQNLLK